MGKQTIIIKGFKHKELANFEFYQSLGSRFFFYSDKEIIVFNDFCNAFLMNEVNYIESLFLPLVLMGECQRLEFKEQKRVTFAGIYIIRYYANKYGVLSLVKKDNSDLMVISEIEYSGFFIDKDLDSDCEYDLTINNSTTLRAMKEFDKVKQRLKVKEFRKRKDIKREHRTSYQKENIGGKNIAFNFKCEVCSARHNIGIETYPFMIKPIEFICPACQTHFEINARAFVEVRAVALQNSIY